MTFLINLIMAFALRLRMAIDAFAALVRLPTALRSIQGEDRKAKVTAALQDSRAAAARVPAVARLSAQSRRLEDSLSGPIRTLARRSLRALRTSSRCWIETPTSRSSMSLRCGRSPRAPTSSSACRTRRFMRATYPICALRCGATTSRPSSSRWRAVTPRNSSPKRLAAWMCRRS